MPKYYAGFDVTIIPYLLNDYTVGGCFPVKFHEGLAAGVPSVVTNLPAYAPFADVCYISKSANEFSQNIRRALEEDSEIKVKERQHVAKDNNWEGKVAKMLALIQSFIDNQ
jgi:glycosyltransferase involved in cell wall biosynthesis